MRTTRKQSESNIYHVVSRGTGRQLIFEDDVDRAFFLDLIEESLLKHECKLYAWCLMGNHFHLLLKAPITSISAFMRQICGQYAQRFNFRHERVGHLFQDRFWSEPVDGDEYFLTVVRYIHQNPEKPHIAKHDEYPWSSYREYMGWEMRQPLCETELALGMLGDRQGFAAFHRSFDNRTHCIDVPEQLASDKLEAEHVCLEIARTATGLEDLSTVKSFNRPQRNDLLRTMRQAGLSIRQIERMTGISRGVIQEIV